MHPIIECHNISKVYKNKVAALQNISCQISPGDFVAIVGRSGSGKSTLLNLIGGLDVPSAGTIHILGKKLNAMNAASLARHRRFTVGMIFQSFNLIPSRTAAENVELALLFGGVAKSERAQKATDVLKTVGLQDRLHHKPGELSGGEQQRVAIARALANQPKILLADEPTGNLDSKTAASILTFLAELNRTFKITILMVTHDAASAKKITHRMIQLLDGRIIEDKKYRGKS